jgi:hypothetical protein
VLLGNNEIFKPDVICTCNVCSNLDGNSDRFITLLPYWPISFVDVDEFAYKIVAERSVLCKDAVKTLYM